MFSPVKTITSPGLSENFEVGGFIIEVSGYFAILHETRTKKSEERPSRVAGQERQVSGNVCWLPATFDNPASPTAVHAMADCKIKLFSY